MYASASKRRFAYFLCVMILVIAATFALATPRQADPPLGTWNGQLNDRTAVTLTLTEDGGFFLDGTSPDRIAGTWTWNATSSVAGTLHCEPVDWPSHPASDYNVIWLGPGRIGLSIGEVTIVLHRMI